MGIDTFLLCQSAYGPVEIFNGGVLQDESLDTGSHEFENLLLDPGGADIFCTYMVSARLPGWFPPLRREKIPPILLR
jgi:hypothetical protein